MTDRSTGRSSSTCAARPANKVTSFPGNQCPDTLSASTWARPTGSSLTPIDRQAEGSSPQVFGFDELVASYQEAAEGLIEGWQNHFEQWKQVGSDRPYHYLGSAIWYTRIGHAMGESMLELMGDDDS